MDDGLKGLARSEAFADDVDVEDVGSIIRSSLGIEVLPEGLQPTMNGLKEFNRDEQ